jgi:hypothetical protein
MERAITWFDQSGSSLPPDDRKQYCEKLAARASELGVRVPDDIRKYSSTGYAPDGEMRVAVQTRMQFWSDGDPEKSLLEGLLEKRASVPPEVFCEALRVFDEATGLDSEWDRSVADPVYSTFGFIKEAMWTFRDQGLTLDEGRLFRIVMERSKIAERFGDEIADAMQKEPIKIFNSLPLNVKRIITRLANDKQS